MFQFSSLITSREVFFCERRLQKTEPYQSPRVFRACTDFGSLLTKKNLPADCSADRFRRFLLSIFLFLVKCKYCDFVRSQRICHMVWLSVTFSLDRFEYRIIHMMLSAVSRVRTAQD
mgnify:FL=1